MSGISGLDDLMKNLDNLRKKAQSLQGERQVPLIELLNSQFMAKHTSVNSFSEFLELGGFEATVEGFEAIPDDVFERHVITHSDFGSWSDMQEAALTDYVKSKLGF